MLSASEMFIQDREADAFIGNKNVRRDVMKIREYNNDRLPLNRYTDANEEMDCKREMDDARQNSREEGL